MKTAIEGFALQKVNCFCCGKPIESIFQRQACPACIARYDRGDRFNEDTNQWAAAPLSPSHSRKMAYWIDFCPTAYQNTDPNRKGFPRATLSRIMAWQYNPRGLILNGPTATCKTRCLFLLLKRLILEENLKVRIFFAEEWSAFVAENCSGDIESLRMRKQLQNIDILAFDDLFAEKMSDRAESLLFAVLDARLRNQKPIFATCMFTGSLVKFQDEVRGLAILRRLRETCEVIQMK